MVDEVQKNTSSEGGISCISHKAVPMAIGMLGIVPPLCLLVLSCFFVSDSIVQWVAVFGTLLAALFSIWLWYDHLVRAKMLKWLKVEHSLTFTTLEKK